MNEEEIYEMILNEDVEKYPLLNEIFAIRDNRHKVNNYTICVNGYISLDVINKAIKLQKENEELKNDYENLSNSVVVKNHYIKNSIPIQKVKDEIEKLNKKIDESIDNSKGGLDKVFIEEAGELLAQKRVLQELLEGRK